MLATSKLCTECCKLKQKLDSLKTEWLEFSTQSKNKPLNRMSREELIKYNVNLQQAIHKLQDDHNKLLLAVEQNNVELSATQAQLIQKIIQETSGSQPGILPLLIQTHAQYHTQHNKKNGRRYHPTLVTLHQILPLD